MVGALRVVFDVRQTWRLCSVIFVSVAVCGQLHQASLEHRHLAAALRRRRQPVVAEGSVEHLLGVVTDLQQEHTWRKSITILRLPNLCSRWVAVREKDIF